MKDKEITFQMLLDNLKTTNESSLEKIKEAYFFACDEHVGLKRLSGDDYITHPLHVANILASLNVDDTTIIAALIHEVLNNGKNATKDLIEEKFGEDVARIVDSVSKINKLELVDETESSALYLRKVLVGLAEDPRVLYIKLADRLHNMRTIEFLRRDRQIKMANETKEILIPIAEIIGIRKIRSELQNLVLKCLEPEAYEKIKTEFDARYLKKDKSVQELQIKINQALNKENIVSIISGWPEHYY